MVESAWLDDKNLNYQDIYEVQYLEDGTVVLQFHVETKIEGKEHYHLEIIFKNEKEFLNFLKNCEKQLKHNKKMPLGEKKDNEQGARELIKFFKE